MSRETNKEGVTGPPKEYAAGALQMGWRVNSNPKDREEIDNRFQTITDHSGKPMAQVCKEYWEKKRRGG